MSVAPRLAATLALLAVAVAATAADPTPQRVFESFEVNPHDEPERQFRFSRAAATEDDPIVITAVGREFTKADREYRTDLQKVWLQRNVPKTQTFAWRGLVSPCGVKLGGGSDGCDRYEYTDAKGKQFSYHLYVGNWP